MSLRIRAELAPTSVTLRDFAPVLYHRGTPAEVLARWRRHLDDRSTKPSETRELVATNALQLMTDRRILLLAAQTLRANGPRAPGPNGLTLNELSDHELFGMSTALEQALRKHTYRVGAERVVWVPKASGQGKRPIVLMDVQDRVVQKAAAMVLQPLLDSRFDNLSFGGRPGRHRGHALAVAELLAREAPIWLAHDLRDAYRHVSVSRLLQVFGKWLPNDELIDLLAMILPPQDHHRLGGIKQGGPLSALALEVHLSHFLHRPWRRQAGHDVHLLRYADDLLVITPSRNRASQADQLLREILLPTGLRLKHDFAQACHDIRTTPIDWLGYQLALVDERFRVAPGDNTLAKLKQCFVLAYAKPQPVDRGKYILHGWAGQLGPCYATLPKDERQQQRRMYCEQAVRCAVEYGFEEVAEARELRRCWIAARQRFLKVRRAVCNARDKFE